jgi:sensor histidine kinase regulating citrate/malate metabolism
LTLKISDNGIGIDLEKNGASLFGLYKTFHPPPAAQGIGLYITKYQLDQMGVAIKVESEVNKETTFTIYFKLNQASLYLPLPIAHT